MPKAGKQSFDGTAKAAERGNEDKALKKALQNEQRWTRIVANDLENIPLVSLASIPPPSPFSFLLFRLTSLFSSLTPLLFPFPGPDHRMGQSPISSFSSRPRCARPRLHCLSHFTYGDLCCR